MRHFLCFIIALLCTLLPFPAYEVDAEEIIQVKLEGKERELIGKTVVSGEDGSALFMTKDGHQWLLEAGEIVKREESAEEFKFWSADELGPELLKSLPQGFKLHSSQHYLVAYETSDAYARWVAILYERLYRGFHSYWKQFGVEIEEPTHPMIVIILDNQASFKEFATEDTGADPGTMLAYYHMLKNRVVMYDMTGVEEATNGQRNIKTSEQISKVMSQPNSLNMVATIIHEATHQLAYNSGLQQRLAPVPMWLNEGLAEFFETPDVKSKSGWKGIGVVNGVRLQQFRGYQNARQADSLETLIKADDRFRDGSTVLDAYAESWVLFHYLAKTRKEKFGAYIKFVSEKKPLVEETPEQRLKDFQTFFGDDVNALDRELVRYSQKLRL